MNKQIEIPVELYEDEVVCFFADRYRTSPEKIVRCFLSQGGFISESEDESAAFRLEENEMEILSSLLSWCFSL